MLDALVAEARLRWGFDPANGLQVIAGELLVATPLEPTRPLLIVPLATLGIDQRVVTSEPLPGRAGPGGGDPLAVLGRLYGADHPVGRIGAPDGATVGSLTGESFDRPLFLRPVAPEFALAGPWALPWISARLRAPDGCPWDREQTHLSLRKHLLEEAYEVYDVLEGEATPELAAELGDLWLQIVLHAQLAAEAGIFDLTDVQAAIASKIVRRHPHVFGDAVANTASDVNRQWERIKADERAATDDSKGALDGISRSMPALAASQEMQDRAANLGYDWPSIEGVLDKVAEETEEFRQADTDVDRAEEFGDLVFVLVNLARRSGIDAESAVRAANAKFGRRFANVERAAAARGVALRDLDFDALDALWDAAKAEERMT